MTKNNKKKSAREKRILAASIIVAAVMVAGSTFAWFTSKDEVTNRLSASADYDVTIAEDFTPPEDWVPGQQINKDVSAVNTGNVDAFVRMYLEGEMSVFKRTSQTDSVAIPTSTITALTATTDQQYKDLMYTYYDASGNYYRELDKTTKRDNPLNNGASSQDANEDNKPAQFSEVQAMQAGGYLASVPSGAQYYFIVEQATTIEAYATTDATAKTTINLKAGDIVATKGATVTPASGQTAAYIDAGTKGISTDTSEFHPQTEGVYLFRRNVDLNATANTADDYEYSGYYYVPKSASTDATGTLIVDTTSDHYLALYTERKTNDSDRSDYTVPDNAITADTAAEPSKETVSVSVNTTNMKFYNAKETVVENKGLTWAYTAAVGTDPAKLTATYDGGTTSDTSDDIVIDVTLANIDNTTHTGQTWTVISATAGSTGNSTNWKDSSTYYTFYYNDDVEEGDTTTKLVDSVTLSKDTTQHAFIAFDFDLNVFMDSVQVTKNEAGQEMTTPVEANGEFAGTGDAAPAYATAQTKDEIADIEWNDVT